MYTFDLKKTELNKIESLNNNIVVPIIVFLPLYFNFCAFFFDKDLNCTQIIYQCVALSLEKRDLPIRL